MADLFSANHLAICVLKAATHVIRGGRVPSEEGEGGAGARYAVPSEPTKSCPREDLSFSPSSTSASAVAPRHAKRLLAQAAPTPSSQREERRLPPLPDAGRRLLVAVRRRRGPTDAAPARPQRHAGGVAEAPPGGHADGAHPVPLPVGLVPAGTLLLERVLPYGRALRREGRLAAAGAHPRVHLPRPDRESPR